MKNRSDVLGAGVRSRAAEFLDIFQFFGELWKMNRRRGYCGRRVGE